MHDIVIRGGELVDGTGTEPMRGDLAISDGLIRQVGDVDGKGRQEIHADGLTVTPGFIDLHTHLDAQIGWDPALTPVSWHGVTTVLMGNCGVTFAPCKPADQELLAGMMETVEDIPKNAILTGLPWDWEDYGGYLDAIERLRPGINVAGMVGHCAVRFYVMGERAVEEQASDDERRQMADIVGASIDRGAVGFSTNRHAPHRLPDGRSVPGTFADPAELVEISKAVAPRNALMQAVGANFDVLKQIAGPRVLFSYGAGPTADSGLERKQALDELRAEAGRRDRHYPCAQLRLHVRAAIAAAGGGGNLGRFASARSGRSDRGDQQRRHRGSAGGGSQARARHATAGQQPVLPGHGRNAGPTRQRPTATCKRWPTPLASIGARHSCGYRGRATAWACSTTAHSRRTCAPWATSSNTSTSSRA